MSNDIHLTYVNSHVKPPLGRLIDRIVQERENQDFKWGRNFPTRNDDRWLTIATEELGEAAIAILKGDEANLTDEILQLAAVCLAWLELRVPMADQEGEAPTG